MPPKLFGSPQRPSSNPNYIPDLRVPPENWFISISENIYPGRPYYFNVLTNERQWNFPEDYNSVEALVPETRVVNRSQVAEHVFGFIVFFDRKKEMMGGFVPPIKIVYSNIEIAHVLARSVYETEFIEVTEHLHRLWRSSDHYVRSLREYHQKENHPATFCQLHNDIFSGCRIEQTLFITEKVDEATALLIQGNWKNGNIIMDIDGIMSQNIRRPPSRMIGEFLTDPVPRSYTFFKDEDDDSLIDIDSIEFNKIIVFNSIFVITARIMHSAESAINKIELALRNSETPFTDSINMYYQNDCYRLGGTYSKSEAHIAHIADFKKFCEDEQPYTIEDGGTLSCWIDLAFLTGVISYEEYLELNKEIEEDRTLHTEHDIVVKYIMIILKKVLPNGNQNFREEIAKVKCIRKQKFVHTDLLLPLFK